MDFNITGRHLSMLTKGLSATLLAGALALPFAAEAKPAYPGIIRYELPDGSVLPIRLMGDEHAHRTFTEDGYLLISDGNGGFEYATLTADGSIISTHRAAVAPEKRSAADLAVLSKIDREKLTLTAQDADASIRMKRQATAKRNKARKPTSQEIDLLFSDYPSIGSPKALVVLVEYADVKFTTENPLDYFTRMISEPGFSDYGSIGSALDYFTQNSNGLFTPDFDVYGPVVLPQDRKYYGGNTWSGDDQRPEEMAIHALQALDQEIDFSQYDTDGDGYIDNVYIFYAGKGEADYGGDDTVWPHSWNVTYGGHNYKFDGVILDRYACSNEIDNTYNRPDGIGTFVHEFSHVMGLPDLYETTYATGAFTPGSWSCLDYGPYNNRGLTPPNYGLFERYSLGWVEPKHFSGKATAEYVIEPVTTNDGYLVQTDNNNEFMLIEVRDRKGWDAFIPNSGMLVWRIDYDNTAWTYNTVNNNASRQRVDIIEADGRQTENSRAGDCFPGTASVTEFTFDTNPAFASRTGKSMNVEFTNIHRLASGNVAFTATHDLPEWNAVGNVIADGNEWDLDGRSLHAATDVDIYNPAGARIASVRKGMTFEIPAAGIYIVRSAAKSAKIAVR